MTGYIGTWSGKVLKTTNGGLTFANSNTSSLPQKVNLQQNFPNTFNPATTISFTLPNERFVKITVIDVSGKTVAGILNDKLGAGEHRVNWNVGDLPGGVYFARLVAGDQTITRSMILLK